MTTDPLPFRWHNRDGSAQMLVVCDHASNALPPGHGNLGLTDDQIDQHIAWDIGAAAVAEHLADRFDAPAIFSNFSRLLIDCNRYPADPASIAPVSDGVTVAGNLGLSAAEIERRREKFFQPYHDEIETVLDGFIAAGRPPVLLSVHSFTPNFNGARRPWQIGVCWLADDRMAARVMAELRAGGTILVGDNQPYALDPAEDYTLIEHGLRRGLAHLLVEFSQELVADAVGARHWADRLAPAVERALQNDAVRQVRHYWP